MPKDYSANLASVAAFSGRSERNGKVEGAGQIGSAPPQTRLGGGWELGGCNASGGYSPNAAPCNRRGGHL